MANNNNNPQNNPQTPPPTQTPAQTQAQINKQKELEMNARYARTMLGSTLGFVPMGAVSPSNKQSQILKEGPEEPIAERESGLYRIDGQGNAIIEWDKDKAKFTYHVDKVTPETEALFLYQAIKALQQDNGATAVKFTYANKDGITLDGLKLRIAAGEKMGVAINFGTEVDAWFLDQIQKRRLSADDFHDFKEAVGSVNQKAKILSEVTSFAKEPETWKEKIKEWEKPEKDLAKLQDDTKKATETEIKNKVTATDPLLKYVEEMKAIDAKVDACTQRLEKLDTFITDSEGKFNKQKLDAYLDKNNQNGCAPITYCKRDPLTLKLIRTPLTEEHALLASVSDTDDFAKTPSEVRTIQLSRLIQTTAGKDAKLYQSLLLSMQQEQAVLRGELEACKAKLDVSDEKKKALKEEMEALPDTDPDNKARYKEALTLLDKHREKELPKDVVAPRTLAPVKEQLARLDEVAAKQKELQKTVGDLRTDIDAKHRKIQDAQVQQNNRPRLRGF